MTPERYHRVKDTLARALECEDTQQRVAFLNRNCADDSELRAEV